jgi:ABC-type branched-subunit amino acid transport system substrate-binding protein
MALAIEKSKLSGLAETRNQIRENLKSFNKHNPNNTKIKSRDWDIALQEISKNSGLDYIGASGSIEFDENGDIVADKVVLKSWNLNGNGNPEKRDSC